MNNDETFLDLLSSQRKLLAQIAQEGRHAASAAAQDAISFGRGYGGNNMMPAAANGFEHHAQRSFVAPNHSISHQRPTHHGRYTNKRLSLDLGNAMINVPPSFGCGMRADNHTKAGASLGFDAFGSFGCDALIAGDSSSYSYGGGDKKGNKEGFGFDDFSVAKKRRFSGAGLLFSDGLPAPQFQESGYQRRFSMTSVISDRFPEEDLDDVDGEDLLHTFDTTTPGPAHPQQFKISRQPLLSLPPPPLQRRPMQSTSPLLARSALVNLSDTMAKSQKSQQDIHDWDKKMGLKRSHSKTMRLSMRSRKKLRAMLKKKINAASKGTRK